MKCALFWSISAAAECLRGPPQSPVYLFRQDVTCCWRTCFTSSPSHRQLVIVSLNHTVQFVEMHPYNSADNIVQILWRWRRSAIKSCMQLVGCAARWLLPVSSAYLHKINKLENTVYTNTVMAKGTGKSLLLGERHIFFFQSLLGKRGSCAFSFSVLCSLSL